MKKLLFTALAIAALAVTGAAAQTVTRSNSIPSVTLAWNAVSDPSVVGYRLYQGAASATYTNVFQAGSNLTVTATPLVRGTTYFFAATCYTSAGLESAYSVEISYTVPQIIAAPTNLVLRVNSP